MRSNPDCIFCRLVARKLPADVRFENEEFFVFPDIHPKAPIHLLLIPKEHAVRSMAELEPDQTEMIGRLMLLAKRMAEEAGIAADGYRLVFNVRHHGGQEVDHLHLHLLGGRPLGPLG